MKAATLLTKAEHAVKAFAWYRLCTDGMMGEDGLSDYLVLLSVQQTCKYRGVNFLEFLLSQEEDVEEYCRSGRKKRPPPTVEVYPENFSRTHFKSKEDKPTAGEADINKKPTVPKGSERLRITPTPLHDDAMMDRLVDALVDVWSHLGIKKAA